MPQKSSVLLLTALSLMGSFAIVIARGAEFRSLQPLTQALPPLPGIQTSSPPLTFATMPQVPAGRFHYGGSNSWAPIRLRIDSAIQTARPEFQLRYLKSESPSETDIERLLNGTLDFAQTSQPLTELDHQQAKQQGTEISQIPVALDGLAVAVHPSLAVPGLTIEQLKQIYSGQITNWQVVGGPNLAINPYRNPDKQDLFTEVVMKYQPFSSDIKTVATPTEALRILAQDPGGIYYASAPLIVPQCIVKTLPLGRSADQLIPPYQEPYVPASRCPAQRNQINQEAFRTGEYPLVRSLFVVIKHEGIAQQSGEAYANLLLTPEGQDMLFQSGFVKLR